MDLVARATGISHWPARPSNPAMVVHLPDRKTITRFGDKTRWQERAEKFGPTAISFWQWQERTADALWELALNIPPWPPQTLSEFATLVRSGLGWLGSNFPQYLRAEMLADAFRPVSAHLRHAPESLRIFVDAQLLIASQTTSRYANALYGASALDLPRRGTVHLAGGIGSIAETLANAVKSNGGTVLYKQEVSRIVTQGGDPVGVETKRGDHFPADALVVNLPPWNIVRLLGDQVPRKLRRLSSFPRDGWGAFMLYIGLDSAAVPADFSLHHQVIVREPLAEGNTVFMSLSPDWDMGRAPDGHRAMTLSTHTNLSSWWQLWETDRPAYEARKAQYTEQLLKAAQTVLPNIREAATLILPGTPVTFQRFTRRQWGWVGGFPQVDLFRTWAPRLMPRLWMVGDSIFPGQSTAAVAMGGLRVASAVRSALGVREPTLVSPDHHYATPKTVDPTTHG
jgi:phytoene dehydrogenase-like protein